MNQNKRITNTICSIIGALTLIIVAANPNNTEKKLNNDKLINTAGITSYVDNYLSGDIQNSYKLIAGITSYTTAYIGNTKKSEVTAANVSIVALSQNSATEANINANIYVPEKPEIKYDLSTRVMNPSRFVRLGTTRYNGHRWTYYSQRVLPGHGLNIPGRHIDEYGFVCDGDNYIVLAADLKDVSRHTILDTPFGKPGKVYDTGCDYGTIDCYCNW